MCSWEKKESDYVGMPTYVMWKKGVTAGKKGEQHKTQSDATIIKVFRMY